jgi:hypothetical protein
VQIVTARVHVLAGLRIRTAGKPRRNAPAKAAASAAPQSTIIVNDVATAALHIAQLSALPASGGILAIRHQDVIMKINVPAGLLIGSWRSRLCLGNPQSHNERHSDRRTSQNATHKLFSLHLAGIP